MHVLGVGRNRRIERRKLPVNEQMMVTCVRQIDARGRDADSSESERDSERARHGSAICRLDYVRFGAGRCRGAHHSRCWGSGGGRGHLGRGLGGRLRRLRRAFLRTARDRERGGDQCNIQSGRHRAPLGTVCINPQM